MLNIVNTSQIVDVYSHEIISAVGKALARLSCIRATFLSKEGQDIQSKYVGKYSLYEGEGEQASQALQKWEKLFWDVSKYTNGHTKDTPIIPIYKGDDIWQCDDFKIIMERVINTIYYEDDVYEDKHHNRVVKLYANTIKNAFLILSYEDQGKLPYWWTDRLVFSAMIKLISNVCSLADLAYKDLYKAAKKWAKENDD